MSKLYENYLRINLSIENLNRRLKFLINDYKYHHNRKPAMEIIIAKLADLDAIKKVYVEFIELNDNLENIFVDAEEYNKFYEKQIGETVTKFKLNPSVLEAEDFEELLIIPDVVADQDLLKIKLVNIGEDYEDDNDDDDKENVDISGIENLTIGGSSMEMESPETKCFIAKSGVTSGMIPDTPMLKSSAKRKFN